MSGAFLGSGVVFEPREGGDLRKQLKTHTGNRKLYGWRGFVIRA